MRIGVISPFPVLPPHGGNRARTLAMIRALRRMGHEVHFIYLPSRTVHDADFKAHVQEIGLDATHWLRRKGFSSASYYMRRALQKAKRRFAKMLRARWGHSFDLDEFFYRPFKDQLELLHRRVKFDAVLVQYVSMSKAFEAFDDSVLKVLDTHDSSANGYSRDPKVDHYSLTWAQQARGFRRAHIVLAIQEEEAAHFRDQLGADARRVKTISHMLDLSGKVETISEMATFIGSTFDANLVSLRYFLDQVLPIILQVHPDFQLFVAGTIGYAISESRNVRVLGRVAHVSDAFAQGGIAINPIVKGTGINIKLLDAMAAGVPSVSTAFGARGLDQDSRRGVMVVPDDDPHAFAEAVLRLAADGGLRLTLGQRAYADATIWNARQHAALEKIFQNDRELIDVAGAYS
jgi:polysaccharide biosynthesis protein PslH